MAGPGSLLRKRRLSHCRAAATTTTTRLRHRPTIIAAVTKGVEVRGEEGSRSPVTSGPGLIDASGRPLVAEGVLESGGRPLGGLLTEQREERIA